jgi:hypothetical protein
MLPPLILRSDCSARSPIASSGRFQTAPSDDLVAVILHVLRRQPRVSKAFEGIEFGVT